MDVFALRRTGRVDEMASTDTRDPQSLVRAMDRSVALVLLTRMVPLLAAPVTLWLIATRRPLSEQGPYFVFWNTQALTQLMELGIGSLIVQYASHESPALHWNAQGGLDGDPSAVARIDSLMRQGRSWFGAVALAVLAIAGVGGLWLFGARLDVGERSPFVPWLVTVVCTAAYLPLVPALCTIEGCNGLLRVQRMRLVQVVVAMAVLWALLIRVGALWAVAAFAFVWLAVAFCWLRIRHGGLLVRRVTDHTTPPDGGLVRVQWRTGTAMLAWWVSPQALTPIALATHGASVAGQVGMSLAIATAPFVLASAWLQGRYPRYGALIARGMVDALRSVAVAATWQALAVCAIGTAAATWAVWLLGILVPSVANRALPALAICVLGAANLAWLVVQSLASYLRAWREEPLMEATVAGALVVMGGTLVVSAATSPGRTIMAYSLLVVVGMLPIVLLQFRRQRFRGVA
jgi:hypothetical protein